MKKLIFWIFLTGIVYAFSSCISEKKRMKICSTCPQKDSISYIRKDSVIIRDTTLFITLAGDTIERMIPCPELKPFEVKKKKNGLVTTLRSDGKKITADCDADSLAAELKKYKEREFVEIDSNRENTKILPCPQDHRNWIDHLGRWALLIDLVALALLALWLYIRRKLK